MNELEKRLLRLLPVGSDRPIGTKELMQLLGISRRDVMEMINRLIMKYGIPIIGRRGENSGYYIPKNNRERFEGLRPLRNQTREQLERLDIVSFSSLTEWQKYLKEGEDDGSNSTPN